jgi:predicted RNA-binding Zn ribbon-like protein
MTTHVRQADSAEDADLQLLIEFVNTNDLEGGSDQLESPLLLRQWLADRGLIASEVPADEGSHGRALAIREGIRALGRANNAEELDLSRVTAMNDAALSVPLVVSLHDGSEAGGWELLPAASDVDAFLGRVMAIVVRAMADGTWSRVKACRNDTCRWLFFDQSRNRSGTWCTMAVCGSRMKARAYRARQREAASA